MRPVIITRSLVAADANGIAENQTTAGAADLVLNGALVAGGVAVLGAQRKVAAASTGNIATVIFTVYGTDDASRVITDTITGVNNNSVSTVLDFATVLRVTTSAAVGTNVEIGTSAVGAAMPVPLDVYLDPFNTSLFLDITGTVNVTVQYTGNANVLTSPGPFVWYDHSDLTGVTADDVGTIISPVTAVRLLTNSGAGSVGLTILQAGAAV
jgi:VCBS repeat-containing protein